MSMLDRPISEFDGPADSVRVPVVPPTGECRPFQDVLVELASRLKLPAFTDADGARKFSDYPDFVVNFERAAGHRLPHRLARQGRRASTCAARRIRSSGRCTRRTTASSSYQLPRDDALHAQLEPRLPRLREGQGLAPDATTPVQLALYSRHAADAFASRRRARPPAGSRPSTCASASRPTSTRCRSGTRRSRTHATDRDALSARRDHAAADGDVPLVGFAERVAAPDPQPQLPVREPA